jgi:hypothetical protein
MKPNFYYKDNNNILKRHKMGFKDDLNFEFHKDIFCKSGQLTKQRAHKEVVSEAVLMLKAIN